MLKLFLLPSIIIIGHNIYTFITNNYPTQCTYNNDLITDINYNLTGELWLHTPPICDFIYDQKLPTKIWIRSFLHTRGFNTSIKLKTFAITSMNIKSRISSRPFHKSNLNIPQVKLFPCKPWPCHEKRRNMIPICSSNLSVWVSFNYQWKKEVTFPTSFLSFYISWSSYDKLITQPYSRLLLNKLIRPGWYTIPQFWTKNKALWTVLAKGGINFLPLKGVCLG